MAGGGTDPEPGRWLRAHAPLVRRPTAGVVAWGLLDAGLILGQSLLIAWIAHRAILQGADPHGLIPAFALLGAGFVLRAVATWGRNRSAADVAASITRAMRTERFDAAIRPDAALRHERPSGEVTSALVDQIHALEAYYAHYRPQAALAVLTPLILISAVFVLDWLSGLLLLFAAPLVPLFMSLIGMGAERLAQNQHETQARISAHFLDRLRGMTTLRLFRAGERAADAVAAAAEDHRQSSLKVLRVAFLSSAALELIAAISIAVVAVYIGFSLLGYLDFGPGAELTLFHGLAILLLAPEVFLPLRRFAQHYHDRADALGAAKALLALEADATGRPGAGPGPAGPGTAAAPGPCTNAGPDRHGVAIQLRNVSFRHTPSAEPVFQGAELDIAGGERVTLTGPSGSGKSTLLALMAGLLAPASGTILLDGRTAPGNRPIAWVRQQPWLFHGTLRENLRLAVTGAPDDDLRAALEAADLGDTLEALPDGLDTPLGEDGYGLSGGQVRRLALARASLSAAPLLLLDEPTDGLDDASAGRVLRAIERTIDQPRTVIMVTHDPRLQERAERTVHLAEGRIHA